MHRTGMTNYTRYLYVNPIEGWFTSYQSQAKFPNSPSYSIKLNEIKECEVLIKENQAKWYFKRNSYYFVIRSDNKTSVFFHDNLDLVNYWTSEI